MTYHQWAVVAGSLTVQRVSLFIGILCNVNKGTFFLTGAGSVYFTVHNKQHPITEQGRSMITRTAPATMGTTRSLLRHGLLVDIRARCKSLPHEDVRGLDDLAVAVLASLVRQPTMKP